MLVLSILVLLTDSRVILQPNFCISNPLQPLAFSNNIKYIHMWTWSQQKEAEKLYKFNISAHDRHKEIHKWILAKSKTSERIPGTILTLLPEIKQENKNEINWQDPSAGTSAPFGN